MGKKLGKDRKCRNKGGRDSKIMRGSDVKDGPGWVEDRLCIQISYKLGDSWATLGNNK